MISLRSKSMSHQLSRLSLILLIQSLMTPAFAQLKGNVIDGIHVHRSGDSPHFKKMAEMTAKGLEGQCKGLKSVCSMLPAAASARDNAVCAAVSGGFQIKGKLSDVGKQETDEYFAIAKKMAVKKTKKVEMRVKSTCEVEVVEQESIDIRHYVPGGYTQYELKDDARKGRHWLRSTHKWIDPKAGATLAGVFPMSDASKVSRSQGHKTLAHHKCEVREVTGPWSGTLCLKNTATPFPGHVTLAAKIISSVPAGVATLLEEEVDSYSEKLILPMALFFPPSTEKVESARAPAKSPDNPTQKWCAKQKEKTGIDPCEGEPDDD